MAKGKLIRSQLTVELLWQKFVRRKTASQAETQATSEQSQEVKALMSRFDGGSQSRCENRNLRLLYRTAQKGNKSQKFLQIQSQKKTVQIPIQNQNYKLLVLQLTTMI
jgi:hypothetical protein